MRTERFEQIALLEQAIAQDAAHGERYAARFILVEGLRPWRDVLALLERRGITTLRMSELCDEDNVPNLGRVMASVEAAVSASDASVGLLPLGEILRLAPSLTDPYLARLTRLTAGDRRRVYVPLLDVAGIVGSELDRQDQYAESSPPVWTLAGGGQARVAVSSRDYRCLDGKRCQGMRAYLAEWEDGGREHQILVTELATMLTGSMGAVSVDLIAQPYDVITACCLDARALDVSLGTNEQWGWLADNLRADESLAVACARLLNARRFEPAVLWDAWRREDDNLRWLAWIWLKIAPLGEGLFAACASASTSPDELIELLAITPLRDDRLSESDLAMRRDGLRQSGLDELPQAFWSALGTVDDPITRLAALPGLGNRDRTEIIRSLAGALEQGIDEDSWRPLVAASYPELEAFLQPPPLDPWLKRYVALAAKAHVRNERNDESNAMNTSWRDEPALCDVPDLARHLEKLDATPDETLWVDGLTLAWLGLLIDRLDQEGVLAQASCALAPPPGNTEPTGRQPRLRIAADNETDWPDSVVQALASASAVVDEIVSRIAGHNRLIVASRECDPALAPGPDGTSPTPVLVVSPRDTALPEIVDWERQVKLGVRGEAEIAITLSGPCAELSLHLGQDAFAATPAGPNRWQVAVDKQSAGRRTGRLICARGTADRGSVGEIELTFSRGMVETDLGI